jgi:DNA-binding CsgD family transcriptional regulator
MGFVLDANAAADGVLDNDVRICNRRLAVRDKAARSRLDALLDQVRTAREADPMPAEPIVVRRIDKRPVVIRVLPIDGAARSPFLGARVLLLLTDLERKPRTNAQMLAAAFGLSPAETRLAVHIAAGLSPEMAAEEIGIAVNTARNQLKSILAKTDTHRQGELVALLARLGSI